MPRAFGGALIASPPVASAEVRRRCRAPPRRGMSARIKLIWADTRTARSFPNRGSQPDVRPPA